MVKVWGATSKLSHQSKPVTLLLPLLILELRVHIFSLNHSCMFLLSSVRVCVCVFIYKRLFVLRELSGAKLQTNLAGGRTDKCNRVWMLLNIMIFTDLAFIPLRILMSSGNCMLACPYRRGLCWVTGIMRSQQHLAQYWFDEAYIIHACSFTSTLFKGSTLLYYYYIPQQHQRVSGLHTFIHRHLASMFD